MAGGGGPVVAPGAVCGCRRRCVRPGIRGAEWVPSCPCGRVESRSDWAQAVHRCARGIPNPAEHVLDARVWRRNDELAIVGGPRATGPSWRRAYEAGPGAGRAIARCAPRPPASLNAPPPQDRLPGPARRSLRSAPHHTQSGGTRSLGSGRDAPVRDMWGVASGLADGVTASGSPATGGTHIFSAERRGHDYVACRIRADRPDHVTRLKLSATSSRGARVSHLD